MTFAVDCRMQTSDALAGQLTHGFETPRPAPRMARVQPPLNDLTHRIRAEYREMPGLCLTPGQAERLWALDGETCVRILAALIADGSLRRTRDGRFIAV